MSKRGLDVRMIAVVGVMIALVCVFTLTIRVPFAPTGGYFNFSDVAIYFASFAFGPWVGFLAGGVGTGLADIFGGFAHFAPWSFLIHGLEGLVAGYFGRRGTRGMVIGWALGAVIMVAGYFLVELVLYGFGPAAGEAISVNVPQVVVGGIVGIPLVLAVRRAYPPITQMGSWRDR